MTLSNHLRLGLASWIAAGALTGTAVTPISIGLALFGAMLPDIDHPKSYLGQRCPPVPWLLRKFTQHRGFTHSAMAVLFLTLALAVLTLWQYDPPAKMPRTYWPLWVGYVSAILGDLLTAGGVQLGWPSKKWWRLPKAPASGTLAELILCYLAIAGATFLWIDRGHPIREWQQWGADVATTITKVGPFLTDDLPPRLRRAADLVAERLR